MTTETMSAAKRRILHSLKTDGPQTATQLARSLALTPTGVRQHLCALSEAGLVRYREEHDGGVGRPARRWALSGSADEVSVFPDRHSDLAVAVLRAVEEIEGETGVDSILGERRRAQARAYGAELGESEELDSRVVRLAEIRTREGYMAEARSDGDGSVLLIENNCPICTAAANCQQLCDSEKALFIEVLGPDVEVERTEHLLSGDRRCVYRIASTGSG